MFFAGEIFSVTKKVHRGLLWVEIEASSVEEDRCLVVLGVAITSYSSLDRLNLAVDSLGHRVGDAVERAIADHVVDPLFNRPSCLLQWLQSGVNHLPVPPLKKSLRLGRCLVVP